MAPTRKSTPRTAGRKATPSTSRSATPTRISKPKPAKLVALNVFISNAFYDFFVQDQDDISDLAFNRVWSKSVKENVNGTDFDFNAFHDFVQQRRAEIFNRELVSQSFVVVNADKEGKTGTVAHTGVVSGVQDGKNVIVNIVAVLNIGLEKGRRMVERENVALSVEPAPEH